MSDATVELRPAEAILRELVGHVEAQSYAPGIELLRQGAPVESAYVIAEGMVKLSHVNVDGKPTILSLRSQGWILGAAAATCGVVHPITAATLTTCRLHRVSATRFRTLLRRRAGLSWYVHEMHSREIHEHLVQVVGLRSQSARQRLGQLLRRFLPPDGEVKKGIRLELPLRLWEVAQLIAVTPSYLSDLLGHLEAEGLIQRRKGWVIVRDPHRLSSEDP